MKGQTRPPHLKPPRQQWLPDTDGVPGSATSVGAPPAGSEGGADSGRGRAIMTCTPGLRRGQGQGLGRPPSARRSGRGAPQERADPALCSCATSRTSPAFTAEHAPRTALATPDPSQGPRSRTPHRDPAKTWLCLWPGLSHTRALEGSGDSPQAWSLPPEGLSLDSHFGMAQHGPVPVCGGKSVGGELTSLSAFQSKRNRNKFKNFF